MPGDPPGQQPVRLLRAPAALRVWVHGGGVAEYGVDDRPHRFHGVLAGEQPPVTVQGSSDEPVVGTDVRPGQHREREVLRQGLPAGAGLLSLQGEVDPRLGPDPEAEPVPCGDGLDPEHVMRGLLKGDSDLGGGDRHALARPDQDRHPGPPPTVGAEPDRDVRLHGRIGVDAVDLAVAVVLAAHRVFRGQRAQRVHHLVLGVPPGRQAGPARRLGQDGRQHLEHVVLEHVPDGPGPVVEPATVRDVELLRHRDLDVVHVGAVEQRLDHRVGETGEQDVLHGVEGQPVVNPEDRLFGEVLVHDVVQVLRTRQVGAEGLLNHDPGAARAARGRDPLGDPPEQDGRHFQVVQDMLARADLIGHGLVGGVVAEVPVHVAQQLKHPDAACSAGSIPLSFSDAVA